MDDRLRRRLRRVGARRSGFNGAFTDHGNPKNLPWINKFQLRFYIDHTAGKGDLHLWDGGKENAAHSTSSTATGVRAKPLNAAMKTRLEGHHAQEHRQPEGLAVPRGLRPG